MDVCRDGEGMWHFSGFYRAAQSFADDLLWAAECRSSEIQEQARQEVNCAMEHFESLVREAFRTKITELEQCTGSF